MPWAMLSRICTSRGDSGANTCDEPGPYTDSSRNSASTFDATAGRLKTFSLMMNWPARAFRMASRSSAGSTSLFRYAAAPARIASKSVCSSSFAVSTTTPTWGSSRRIRCVTFIPETRGRSASMTSTSGSSSSVFVTASSPSDAVATSSISGSFWRTCPIPIAVRRLESARTMRMERSVFSAKRPSSFAVRGRLDSLRWEQECNGGALARHRLDLQRTTDELGTFAHREQPDRFRAARGLHQIEAASVVGDMQRPRRGRALPYHADGARLGVLVHVLQRLLEHAIHRELVRRLQLGGRGLERRQHLDAAARLPLRGVVAHRLGEAKLGELGRAKVVDHRAHRVERAAELRLKAGELRLEG